MPKENERPPGANTEFAPMSGAPLWIAGGLLALSNFVTVLDTTITNVSVPNIAGGLAVSANQGTWVITSYAVAEAIMVPLSGWLAQRFAARCSACAERTSAPWRRPGRRRTPQCRFQLRKLRGRQE